MIKITLKIHVKNHKEILQMRGGFIGTLYSKIAKTEDANTKVESAIRKDMLERIGGETEKALAAEGVQAEVVAYVEKRSDVFESGGELMEEAADA